MKNANSNFIVCLSLGIFFLMLINHANAFENVNEPRKNVNLSPFEGWLSAYFCMFNHSRACLVGNANYTITLNGTLNVQDSDIKEFCSGGCYDHTWWVLKCIQDVKRDFYFATKAPVSFVQNVTHNSCSNQAQGFNLANYKDANSATSLYGRIYMPLVSTVMTMAFIATFGV